MHLRVYSIPSAASIRPGAAISRDIGLRRILCVATAVTILSPTARPETAEAVARHWKIRL